MKLSDQTNKVQNQFTSKRRSDNGGDASQQTQKSERVGELCNAQQIDQDDGSECNESRCKKKKNTK
jgi:hypothetical protein